MKKKRKPKLLRYSEGPRKLTPYESLVWLETDPLTGKHVPLPGITDEMRKKALAHPDSHRSHYRNGEAK